MGRSAERSLRIGWLRANRILPMSTRGHINAHTHIYSGLAPLGMPIPESKPENFVQMLKRVWWRLDRALDRDSLEASAQLYVAEALLFGTTALVDHHESPNFIEGSLDVLADVCQRLGMRAVLCYGATERNGGREEAKRGLAECRRFISCNRRSLVRGVVGLHASFTVSDDTLGEAAALARELGVGLHLHVAEDLADVGDAQQRGYRGVIDRLARFDALIAGSIFAHGVHLAAGEVRTCAEHDCWLVQNPRSNKGNEVGYPRALGESPLTALGTDGYPADMPSEAEALQADAKANGEDGEAVASRPAKGHDLIEVLFAQGRPPPVEQTPKGLEVDGRLVVADGELLSGDFDAIRAQAHSQARGLWERMGSL